MTNVDTAAQNIPAIATVVNLGVSFLHLKETEKTEKPVAEIKPNSKPNKDSSLVLPAAIIIIPIAAIIIENQTFIEIVSFKNKKPNKAVINGMLAKHSNVIAALVCVIDQIKVIIAIPSPIPPMISVKESKVSSAAGIALDPIEYKIKPKQTKVP